MKENDKEQNGEGSLPDGFFENQFKSIISKTLDVENWSIGNTKNMETQYSVPNGYWLKMEDSIRLKLAPKESPSFFPALKLVYSGLAVAVLILVSYFWFLKPVQMNDEAWKASIDKATQEELLAYVSQSPEAKDITEVWAAKTFKSEELPKEIFPSEIEDEEVLDYYQADELIKSLDVN